MGTSKEKNPKMDWGYYATIPRLIRTGYKDLTPVQKWLYVCLKDLCGESGTCYRALRTLAEETDISLGMLSESVRKLHEKGLIHAEKKRRNSGGKEVWHITIVDIWQLNGKEHPTKECSQNEQSVPNNDVHTPNVHTMNDKTPVCSPNEQKRSAGEQECSLCETEVITITKPVSNNITEARTESSVAIAPPSAPEFQSEPGSSEPYLPDPSLSEAAADADPLDADSYSPGPEQPSEEKAPEPDQPELIARPEKPVMPPESARWCPEIAVQIVEAKLGKYYREAARKKEIAAAQRMIKEDPTLTCEQFIAAYDERDDEWWHDHKGLLHLHHMVEKDRVHEMLDRIEARKAKIVSLDAKRQKQTTTIDDDPYGLMEMARIQAAQYEARERAKGAL